MVVIARVTAGYQLPLDDPIVAPWSHPARPVRCHSSPLPTFGDAGLRHLWRRHRIVQAGASLPPYRICVCHGATAVGSAASSRRAERHSSGAGLPHAYSTAGLGYPTVTRGPVGPLPPDRLPLHLRPDPADEGLLLAPLSALCEVKTGLAGVRRRESGRLDPPPVPANRAARRGHRPLVPRALGSRSAAVPHLRPGSADPARTPLAVAPRGSAPGESRRAGF